MSAVCGVCSDARKIRLFDVVKTKYTEYPCPECGLPKHVEWIDYHFEVDDAMLRSVPAPDVLIENKTRNALMALADMLYREKVFHVQERDSPQGYKQFDISLGIWAGDPEGICPYTEKLV